MKKLFTLIAMVAITLMSYAQNQVFWSNGEILFATPVKGIDSLNYVLDNSVASDTLQLILPHRLVEKPVNAKAFNQTFTGEGSWDIFAPEGTYYNQVHVNVDLTDMKAAHDAAIGEKEAIINYAKSLSSEEIKVFLDQIPTEVLLGHISFRAIDTECKLNSLKKKVLETL